MKRDKLDEKIRDRLLEETKIDLKLREDTWEKINNEIKKPEPPRKQTKRKRWFTSFLIAAAVMIIVIGTMTQPGRAMIQQIKDTFVPNKQVELEIEGQKEPSDVQLEVNEQLSYVIYIDEDHYRMEKVGDADQVVPKEPLGELYPDVFMEISKWNNTNVDKVIDQVKAQVNEEDFSMLTIEEVTEPIEATMIYAMESEYVEDGEIIDIQWDAEMQRYYIVQTDEDIVFMIKQQYFSEAEEGHGVRLDKMLKSFEIITVEE